MRAGRALAVIFALSLCLGGLAARAQEPGARDAYDKVRITGNQAFTAAQLLEAAGITPPAKWQLFRKRNTLKRKALEDGIEDMVLFYQRNGYFEASARLADGGGDTAEIRVTEGAPARVSDVVLSLKPEDAATGPVSPERVRESLPIKKGDVFTVQAYESAQKAVTGAFKRGGFPFAATEAEAVVDMAAHAVEVHLSATPKGPAVFRTISVEGIVHTEETIIRRALTFHQGEPYDQEKVDESQNALYALGLFDNVAIWPKRKSEPGFADMVVRLKEGRHRRVKIGLGYGTYEGVRTQISWETLRVDDRILTLGVSAKISEIETTAAGYLKRPYFLSPSNTLLADAGLGKNEFPFFDFRSLRGRLGVEHKLTKTLTVGLYARGVRIIDVTNDPSLLGSVPKESREAASIPSVQATLTWKTTDDPFSPTKGFITDVSVEPSQDATNGVQFTRAIVEGKSFWSLTPSVVLAARVKLGAIFTGADTSQLHITQRFYAGGPISVRGYRFNILGPISAKGALVGGKGLLEASAELRFPIKGDITGVAFLDAGNAFRKPYNYDLSRLYYGTGLGVRYKTLVGPIGLDLAFRLKKYPLDNSPYLLYFFIGYAF